MNNSLKNKKIIISAGASGIGWATTKIFLSRGATVYLCDIDSKSLNKTKKHPLNNKKLFRIRNTINTFELPNISIIQSQK